MTRDEFFRILDFVITPRQREVLYCYLQGGTDRDIAQQLHCDESNIRHHLRNLAQAFQLEYERNCTFRDDLLDLCVEYIPEKVNFTYHDSYRHWAPPHLQDASAAQASSHPATPTPNLPGRPLALTDPLYVQRCYSGTTSVEERCKEEILKPQALIRIRGPRRLGKTSLLKGVLEQAKQAGYRTVQLNLRQAERPMLSDLDRFLRWFCANVSQALELEPDLEQLWKGDYLGSVMACRRYFQRQILVQVEEPLVLGLDEVDYLFPHGEIAAPFLAMLRSWHEGTNNPELWQRLRFVVAHSTEPYIQFENLNQSPFNVGLAIKLPPLTLAQVQQLAQDYDLSPADVPEMEGLHALVDGHPYLVQLALFSLREGRATLAQLLQTAPTQEGIYGNHLRSLGGLVQDRPALLAALRVLAEAAGGARLPELPAYQLESLGLVRFVGNEAKFSCPLYQQYFAGRLV